MIWLARLLVLQKWRMLGRHGWGVCASVGVLFLAFAAVLAVGFVRWAGRAGPEHAAAAVSGLWTGWLVFGVLTGHDLSWHLAYERLKAFPVAGFVRLYLLDSLLAFASPSIGLIFVVFAAVRCSAGGLTAGAVAGFTASFALLVFSVRPAVSLARAAIQRNAALDPRMRIALALILAALALAGAAALSPGWRALTPGYQFGRIMAGAPVLKPVLLLAAFTLVFSLCDFVFQRQIMYSGIAGPEGRQAPGAAGARLLSTHASWPSTLWRMSLLGLLRNRNALLLLIWGSVYCFCFIFYTDGASVFTFVAFSWMVQLFHAHIRGNLLGVDGPAVWLYYVGVIPVWEVVRAKNQALSLFQGVMVASVLLPGVFRPDPEMGVIEWALVLSFPYSSILFGEIVGAFTSLRYPETIERNSQFAGGMNPGGMLVAGAQFLFLWVFVGATALTIRSAAGLFWAIVLGVPALLIAIRSTLLRTWLQGAMLERRKYVLSRLTVFST